MVRAFFRKTSLPGCMVRAFFRKTSLAGCMVRAKNTCNVTVPHHPSGAPTRVASSLTPSPLLPLLPSSPLLSARSSPLFPPPHPPSPILAPPHPSSPRSPSAARGEGLWARSEGLGARSPLGARGEKTIFGFGAKSVGRGSRGQRRGARVQRRGARVEVRGPRGDGPGARGEGREGVHWEGVQGSEGMGGAFTRCAF